MLLRLGLILGCGLLCRQVPLWGQGGCEGTPAYSPCEFTFEIPTSDAAAHPNPYYYETRGGGRIVYVQAEPTVLRSQADAIAWRQEYAIAVAHLARVFGIVADPACSDWQRHYRLPRATRQK